MRKLPLSSACCYTSTVDQLLKVKVQVRQILLAFILAEILVADGRKVFVSGYAIKVSGLECDCFRCCMVSLLH